MPKLRKMLGNADSPYILSLMHLIETQSVQTIAGWCTAYAEKQILPIYEKSYPADSRPADALEAFQGYIGGTVKLPEVKKAVANANAAAKEAEGNPAAQAAARAVGQAAASIYTPTHSLGMAFYGSAAIAYDRVGTGETPEVYDRIASEECARMEAALKTVSVQDEKNPAKINWYC